jgi:shikimate kinase
MIVFLCGMMGSGKSSLGKKIASKMHWDFIDLDILIEEEEKKTISEIFKNSGENYFRNIETQALQKIILSKKNVIVALGGGTPCFNNNMEYFFKCRVKQNC